MKELEYATQEKKIAYFSMEIGLEQNIPNYSGGLGILAGDTLRSCADLNLPVIGVSLLSRKGYFRQELTNDGWQIEHPEEWNPSEHMTSLPFEVEVHIENRDVKVGAWLYTIHSITGGEINVIFLDTDVEGNSAEDKKITSYLYGGDERYRFKQELVLGIGGVKFLDEIDLRIRRYHMNEGHSSLLTLELLKKFDKNPDRVRDVCVFTTHTPVAAGHDQFSYDLVKEFMGDYLPLETLKDLCGNENLNMTRLALNLSKYVNGVAKSHKESSRDMFPGYEIHSITNGVHSFTWTCESFRSLYDKYIPGWANEPWLFARASIIPSDDIWHAHKSAKKELIDYINKTTNTGMDIDTLTIGFARRATGYKRNALIFSDVDRLKKINREAGLQLVFSGKAHPRDEEGKKMIEEIISHSQDLRDELKIVYLENYEMNLAKKMVSGVDVWLNTPLPPYEASGSSGMKAAHNGVLNFSVIDGWWIEGMIEGITGWSIGRPPNGDFSEEGLRRKELEDLYSKLEYIIAPTYYNKKDAWITMMKNAIGKTAYYFNSHRMMLRYVTEAYF
jgi:starch phosphorylase